MDSLYKDGCAICAGKPKEVYHSPGLTKMVERVLRRIQGGFDVEHKIDPDLFTDSYTALNEAVDRAVKLSVKWGKPDKGFIQELKRNNAVFAAFKAHREQNDLAGLLVDDDGNARSFDSFRRAAAPVIGEYNVNWLQTEYATAVRVARTAVRFKQYEKDGDLYPNGEWLPSRAAEPRMSHRKYYHTVRRLTDPWWETHYPGCVWGCQCDMRNTDKPITHIGDNPAAPGAEPTTVPPSEEAGVRSPGLSRNPARSGELFSRDHPYFTSAYPGAEKAVKGFVDSSKEYMPVPTEKGAVRIHQRHGKTEKKENIKISSYFANKYGYEIDLLPKDDNKPCADAYNRTLGRKEEYKDNSIATAGAIDNAIRSGKNQADHIVLWIGSDISLGDLRNGILNRARRCKNIKTITIVKDGKDCSFTKEQIDANDFEIKQADFK